MHLLSNEVMQALCWTLIHSLWQGLLLAIAGGIIIVLTKKSNSTVRYNLLSVLFFLFVITAGFTFVKQLQLASENAALADVRLSGDNAQLVLLNSPSPENGIVQKSNLDIFVSYFNEHASLIVTIWFVILSAQFIRLIANAGYVQRIKHYKTRPAPKYWSRRMKELAEKLQIKQRVLLLQSEIVKVPVMVGFMKPVILFPFSLMMQLPPEQVEAVLLHELAHIKRKDYFVNLLQHFAEIIFFFNPGVLWISSLMRDERENCCDDIAIAETKSKKEFVHALVSFQEYNLSNNQPILAFPGRKNHLLNRIKRILTNNNKTLNNMEKISLAAGIVVVSLVTIAFTHTQQNDKSRTAQATNATQKNEILNDTIPRKEKENAKFTYVTNIDGKEYRIHEVNDKVTELYIDGTKIPDDKIGEYHEIIERIHIEVKQEQEKMEAERRMLNTKMEELSAQQEQMRKEQDNMSGDALKKSKEDQAKLNAETAELNNKIMELRARQNAQALIDENNSGNDSMALLNKEKAEMYELLAMKKQQDLMANDIGGKKINEELTQEFAKQNAELMALSEQLKIQQEIMKKEAKMMNEKDTKKQAEILNNQVIQLKKEQEQIQLQRKKINEMMLHQDRTGSLSPDQSLLLNKLLAEQDESRSLLKLSDPATLTITGTDPLKLSDPGPITITGMDPLKLSSPTSPIPPSDLKLDGTLSPIPPVPPLEDTKPLKSIINALLDEKIIFSRDELSIELNDEKMTVNGVLQPEKIHDEYKKNFLSGKRDHVSYSKHGGSTHVDININNGSTRANLTETE